MTWKLWLQISSKLAVLLWVGWQYLRLGWRAGYQMPASGDAIIQRGGQPFRVQEMRTRFGWPILALIEIPDPERWNFCLSRQPRLRLWNEIEIGHAAFDDCFLIAPESVRFSRRLAVDAGLRGHFTSLLALLERHQARLSRVVGENGKLGIEINVRWVADRPRAYHAALDWLQALRESLATPAG